MHIFWTVLVVGLLLYSVWRFRQWKAALAKFGPSLPPSDRLSWEKPQRILLTNVLALSSDVPAAVTDEQLIPETGYEVVGAQDVGAERDAIRRAVISASMDGAVIGFTAAEAFGHIDPSVLNAIEFSTADHLHSLPSIDGYVQTHFFSMGTASAEGWLHRLEGYVAEQKAALAFEKAGYVVHFAPTANNAAWDLTVGGHPWQVKEGVDAAGIKDALLNHPGIPIVTGSNLADHIQNPLVHGLHPLDHDSIASTTKESLAGVKEGFHPGLKIPVVTILVSSWREFRLLADDNTTLDRALKNIAIDAAGVGVGMTLGAKAGALAGAWGGPLGAGIGALLGAILGALGGRGAAHAVRFSAFNNAYESYRSLHAQARESVDCAIGHSRDEVRALKGKYGKEYLNRRAEIEADARSQFNQLEADLRADIDHFADRFPSYLRELLDQLSDEEKKVLESMPKRRWWGDIVPGDIELERAAIQSWFKQARRRLERETARLARVFSEPDADRNAEIDRFLKEYVFELQSLADHLAQLSSRQSELRARATRIREDAINKTIGSGNALIREFGARVSAVHGNIAVVINRWSEDLRQAQESVRREAKPLGIRLP